MMLTDVIPAAPGPDSLYDAFTGWANARGIDLYPHQDEAAIELFSGNNVILATPTGSGKTLVATAAQFAALASDGVSFYPAPIKPLVSEKFFALSEIFGAENVGMLTGDASVNPDAPIIACTAEVLANIALREGKWADISQVVMDEFHFYSEPDRGWAWQVPILCLPQVQFLLMSATLGDVSFFADDLTARTGHPTAVVDDAERPIPLTYAWSLDPLHELLEELVNTHQAPAYVVHFTQKSALETAQMLLSAKLTSKDDKARIAEEIGAFRFHTGFGKTLSKLVRSGIGVHHAGMLPRYRRLVEQLAQAGLLKVICGTDTLGVGINVPIRTVVFTGLTKFDGTRHRMLKVREFHQIAGRAGRAGFDTSGHVICQAPEHMIENERLLARAGDDPKKRRRVVRKKAPEGFVSWTEETFERLKAAEPEALVSRMTVNESMILNVVARRGDPVANMRDLLLGCHEDERGKRRLVRRALRLARGRVDSGVLVRLPAPDASGRTYEIAPELQDDFALNQPLAPFALAALDLLDPESPTYVLDTVSIIEAILDDPFAVLYEQQHKARGEAIGEMKADGVEYEERMVLIEDVTWPRPLAELLEGALMVFAQSHPWVSTDQLSPKSVVRDMYERGQTFTEFVSHYGVARSEGLLLRYLSDAYRTLRQTVPEARRTDEFDDLMEWLGETVRQTDSSLLDEWEALTDPDAVAEAAARVAAGEQIAPTRPLTGNARAFRVMIRNAMFQKVRLAADDRFAELARLDAYAAELLGTRAPLNEAAWKDALGDYWDEHETLNDGPAARGPSLLRIEEKPREGVWSVRQVVDDPAGDHDWSFLATVHLHASDEAGEPVVLTESFDRMG